MRKLYLFIRYVTILLIFISTVGWSQSIAVTGKVTSAEDGLELPGVNIVEKGTSNGTITSGNGTYSLNVPSDAILIFTFVGYGATEVPINGRATINVNLKADVTALSEIVVIGYGEVNRRDATGAIASVKAEDFNRGIIASPEQLIQGKTAGVQITSSSGEPGAGVNMRIRGTSSVRGGNNPLFVVDGIPLSGENVSAMGSDFGRGSSSAKNPLNFLNPNDIESIDILKDASATAIYGSRGANGVVIITTKSGKGRKNVLEYTTGISISEQAKTYGVLNASDYLAAYQSLGGDPAVVDYGSSTNWQDEINRTSISHNHNLAYSNGYKTGDYRVSLSYDDQEGIIKNSGLERYTGRFNINQSFLNEKLKFSAQTLFSKVDDQAPPITNTAGFEGDLLASSIFYNPTIPNTPTNFDVSRFGNAQVPYNSDASNPLALLKYHKDVTTTDRNLINLSLGYDITNDLNVKVNTGFDRSQSLRTSAMSGLQNKIGNVASNGRAFLTDQKNESDLLEVLATYKKNIGDNSLNVLLGYSYQEFINVGRNANAANFGDQTNMDWMIHQLKEADKAARNFIPGGWQQYQYQEDSRMWVYDLYNENGPSVTEYLVADNPNLPLIGPRGVTGNKFSTSDELQSFFARGTYNMGEKYFFTASVRADGSTRFGGNNKYGIFPSAAIKWRISEEDFIPELFDDLAVRLGYGITGNQEIPHNVYSGRQRFGNISNNQVVPVGLNNDGSLGEQPAGLSNVSFANPDLQWEQTSQINFGIDFGFLASRLTGSLDIYRKNTTKLLMQTMAAQPAATDFVWENLDAEML